MKIFTKKIFAVATALFLLQWAWAPHVHGDDLSKYDELRMLHAIEISCWDNWCEGSRDFEFNSFTCSFEDGECIFEFSVSDDMWLKHNGDFTCSISISSADELLKDEEPPSMTKSLYREISYCIDGSYYD